MMKTCQFCAEEIQDAAIKCKHCGSMLTDESNRVPDESHSVAPASSEIVLTKEEVRTSWLKIIGICFLVGVAIFFVLAFASSNDPVSKEKSNRRSEIYACEKTLEREGPYSDRYESDKVLCEYLKYKFANEFGESP